MNQAIKPDKKEAEDIDVFRLLEIFRRRWYVVLLTLIFALAGAKLYLRYARPIFESYATLEIVEQNAQLRSFGILRDMDDYTDNINSEIEIIQSRRIIGDAIREMEDVNVSYFAVGRVVTTEMYKKSPFKVLLDTTSVIPWGRLYTFDLLGGRKYRVTWSNLEEDFYIEAYLGEPVDTNEFRFTIIERKSAEALPFEAGKKYQWKPNDNDAVITRAKTGLKVEQMGYNGSMIKISSQDHVPEFTTDFVNSLASVYVEFDKATKAKAAKQALVFINDQINRLKKNVDSSSLAIEDFKTRLDIVTLEQKAEQNLSRLGIYEEKRQELEIQRLAIDTLERVLAGKNEQVILSNTLEGINDNLLTSMVQAYNDLSLEKKTLLQNYTPQHPKVVEISNRIAELRKSIFENVGTVRMNNQLKQNYFKKKMGDVSSLIDSLPGTERKFGSLLREFDVGANVLTNLREKQIDAEINLRSIVSNINPIDKAIYPTGPISPISRKVYTLAGGIGISLGIIIILITGLLKNTISVKEEIEAISTTPVIGVVKRSDASLQHKYPRLQIMENSKSSLSESVRSIRTNLQFILPDKVSKIISITSTMSGEGKSFITINLAGIISMLNKKVVILDLDLRKPKLHYSFGRDNTVGLSTYLVGKCTVEDMMQRTEYEYLDIITSGPIPPNPAELIQGSRMETLLDELRKKYDYILIDTPPVGLVTDGITLLKMSDISLYVLRSDYSKKTYATIPDRLTEEQGIQNLYILLNSVTQTGGKYTSYGYKIYSAGYYSEDAPKTPWWKFWKRSGSKSK